MAPGKPMRLLRSDKEYGEFLLSIQQYKRDLREGNKIPPEDLWEHFEPFYVKLETRQVKNYSQWLHNNRLKIAVDIDKVIEGGVESITAPENERKRIEFQKYVDAIIDVCDSPADFEHVVKKRALEVAEGMYSDGYAEKKVNTVKRYIRTNYKSLKAEIEKQMIKLKGKKL